MREKLTGVPRASSTTGSSDHPLARRVLAGLEPEVLPRLIDLPAIRLATDLIVDDIRASQEAGLVRDDIDAGRGGHRRRGHDPRAC